MVAKPEIAVSHVEELFRDDLGQCWSPAKVTLNWPSVTGIAGPSITIDVVASARPEMTLDQLYKAHLSAAHDVLSAGLLAMEEPAFETKNDMRVSRGQPAAEIDQKPDPTARKP